MAWSHGNREGYATVSALVLSMAIALVVAGSMAVAGADLRGARRDLARVRQDSWFDSAHVRATYQVATTPGPTRVAWEDHWDGSSYAVLAESELTKQSPQGAAASWDDTVFRSLGVEPETVRPLLASYSSRNRSGMLAIANAPAWRACILSLVSPIGAGNAGELGPPETAGNAEPDWRTGQVWRIRIRASDGWTDDRLVRWSGDGRAPVYVIERQLYRLRDSSLPCHSFVQ